MRHKDRTRCQYTALEAFAGASAANPSLSVPAGGRAADRPH